MSGEEARRYRTGDRRADYYARQIAAFREAVARRSGGAQEVIRAEEQPWEDSPQGRLKHLASGAMDGALASCDIYILELAPAGASGTHRHFAEEFIYVIEGHGEDLHWDPAPSIGERYDWPRPSGEPTSRWTWSAGDSILIPPMVAHRHVNLDRASHVRLLCATSRVYETLGFGGIEQLEPAPGR